MKNLFLFLYLLFFAGKAVAQERPCSFDFKGTLYEITADLEKDLNLFPRHHGFKSAKLFLIDSLHFSLEIHYDSLGLTYRSRLVLDSVEVYDLRNKISSYLAATSELKKNQEGKVNMLVASTAVGVGYYGWAIPTALELNDDRAFIGTYMLSAAGSFFVPYILTKDATVTRADASFFVYAQTRGIVHGITVANILIPDPDSKETMTGGVIGSIAGATGGYLWSRYSQMNHGQTSVIAAYGDFGVGFGLATAHIADAFYEEDNQLIAQYTMGGAIAGIVGGALLVKNNNYTRGDALALRASGHLGAFLPFAALTMVEPKNESNYSLAAMIGGATGLFVGHQMARKFDFSQSEGTFLNLGELAGGLFGAGIGFLAANTDDKRKNYTMTGSMIGSAGSYFLLARHFKRQSKSKSNENTSSTSFNVFPAFVQGPGFGIRGVPLKSHPGFGMTMRF